MGKKNIPTSIGENIRKLRELKNITREKVAYEMGLSLSGYSKIERNQVDLTISRMQQIAQVLEVDVSQILNFDITQVFNASCKSLEQSEVVAEAESKNPKKDDYKDKYIQMLEAEIARLKKLIQQ